MHSESELKSIADKALEYTNGYEAEIIVSSGDSALTRFGDNVITQNVSNSGVGISIRLLRNNQMGKASTGNVTGEGLSKCVEIAKKALDVSEKDDSILPLVEPQQYREKLSYYEETHELTPEDKADGVVKAAQACSAKNLKAAGIYSNSGSSTAIANSKGLWAFHRNSNATFSLSAMGGDSSGWAEDSDARSTKIKIDPVIETAIAKAVKGSAPDVIEPGAYTVILEPAAVADLLLFLGWDGFNGLSFVEGRSCFANKTDKQVAGENITIRDDFTHPMTPGTPFDFEGALRQKVTLIENGIFKSTVHDRRTAAQAGVQPTGHAMPQPDAWGPVPLNLIMSPGDSSLEEMIKSTDKGLLITRLHYTNILNPITMNVTGMTRDGFFLIEKGEVVKGLKNMRFTESVLKVLNNVAALSKDLYKTETFWGGGGTIVPAIKVENFHFTSKTEN